MPELPSARAERFEREHGLSAERAHQLAFRVELGDFFELALAADPAHARRLADWISGELVARLDDREPAQTKLAPGALAELVALVAEGKVTAAAGREVLDALLADGGDPASIVADRGLQALADEGDLAEIVARAIAADPDAAEKVRAGNAKAIGALIGPIMRETRGRANGGELTRLIRAALGLADEA
jgi:aspartyl-tRNA(Asn)/glutamyl-tRNA(Gln) amidotransferase subunit B